MVYNRGNIISKGCLRQVGKLQKILGVCCSDKKPLKGKFQGVGGLKQKRTSVGGEEVWIFSYTTQCILSIVDAASF